jgi:hypothetical protein
LMDMQNWENFGLLNRKSFQGQLVFLLPESASTYTLSYDHTFRNYKIIWNEI